MKDIVAVWLVAGFLGWGLTLFVLFNELFGPL